MKNPGETKALLEKALAALPTDFVLTDARSHIRRAIEAINKVDHKRSVRAATVAEQPVFPRMTPDQARKSLEVLDDLIKLEQNNLQQIQTRKQQKQQRPVTGNDDGMQYLND